MGVMVSSSLSPPCWNGVAVIIVVFAVALAMGVVSSSLNHMDSGGSSEMRGGAKWMGVAIETDGGGGTR